MAEFIALPEGRGAVRGDLTVYTVRELRDAILAAGCTELDLSQVAECDSAGLQLLLALRARAFAASEAVRELVALYRLGPVLLSPEAA